MLKKLLVPLFQNGKCVYELPSLKEIKNHCQSQISTLWDATLRFENPHEYYIDLSQKLWDLRNKMIYEYSLK